MATLHPFRAVRPDSAHVEEIASVPYDVINTEEARELAEGKPKSFLHVIRPEIDLEKGIDEHDDAVYAQGAENLRAFVEDEDTVREESPSVYVYRLIMDGREQTGIFGCVSVADYDDEVILKHEKTRPVKEDDRTRHIVEQKAHAEPVMLTFRDDDAVESQMRSAMENDPLYDFEAEDGVRHTIWRVAEPEGLVDAFDSVPNLYVADGHHRCKAASRAAEHYRDGDTALDAPDAPEYEFFPAVLFPMGMMHIMAYNRVVFDLPVSPAEFLDQLDDKYGVERNVDNPVPQDKGTVCLYLDGAWHRMALPESEGDRSVDQLDVARLSEFVLEPMLDITDPRRDANIDFVGGIRGTDELEDRVENGRASLAVSMYPTAIEELLDVSDEGDLMPPKSTWFEPKLRSGLLVHDFADDV
ncbi:hypothetical protein CRI94_01570 [Longibacter salinarum]|uniref:DUF1015 domain-containing protein n=1 Tax=Longibacter salinarum TaxID=1850348 RepID=A0A2A8D294_9BACT|nr:DUF1015 family protein [Longibacter salinarum]PEN15004.1 hypothetical protein CRI94_01570 [Longibacter salinarum]